MLALASDRGLARQLAAIDLGLGHMLATACEVLGPEVDALAQVTRLGLADSAVARPSARLGSARY